MTANTPEKTSTHGGVRPGAGRPKSRALAHVAELRAVEKTIVAALPAVIDKLIDLAKGGDVAASKLLLDRIWGKAPSASRPLAEDDSEPPDDPLRLAEEESERRLREMIAPS